jgi:nanoRNase/pAp phosphatase (c-di-AMP/oligoRNAs hydrolase)
MLTSLSNAPISDTSMTYTTNTTMTELARDIRAARRVLVTTHQKPDGDAMGSVLAVMRACAAVGVDASGWVVDPCEGNLRAFEGTTKVEHVNPRAPTLPVGEFDLAIVVDTGAWTQLEVLTPWLKTAPERVIGFDHHARGDDVAARRIVDMNCGSCTALLVQLVVLRRRCAWTQLDCRSALHGACDGHWLVSFSQRACGRIRARVAVTCRGC